jgi:hypothetical protein
MASGENVVWSPTSWKNLPAEQQPQYEDQDAFERSISKLRSLPPLVQSEEVINLRQQLVEVYEGKRYGSEWFIPSCLMQLPCAASYCKEVIVPSDLVIAVLP